MAVVADAAMLPWFARRFLRRYRELVRAGWQRAKILEREQRSVAEQARLRERACAFSTGALKLAPDLTDSQRRASQDIRAKAETAVDRLGEVIGVLRADAGAANPQSGSRVAAIGERPRVADGGLGSGFFPGQAVVAGMLLVAAYWRANLTLRSSRVRLHGRPSRTGSATSSRSAVTSFPNCFGLRPVNGAIQDGSDAVPVGKHLEVDEQHFTVASSTQ